MYSDWDWLLAGMDRVWAPVATPLGAVLAVAVTLHAVLHKRDVAACIGWIGLAWVAPVWGALFYFALGINRVARRARDIRQSRQPRRPLGPRPQHGFATHLEPLEQAVRRITNRQVEDSNTVAVFSNGDATYPAMLNAIDEARTSVALSTYIFSNDALGRQFVDKLTAARNRGVEVRILLDGIGSGYFPAIHRVLCRAGLRSALFMHSALPWRMPFLNLRNHKKLLIADGKIGFTGGMNIAAENVLADHPRHAVADTHFRLTGPVVSQLMDAFARDWAFTTREDLDGPTWFSQPDTPGSGGCAARVITSGPDQDLEKIEMVLLEAIGCATRSIQIMTPYFLPHDGLVVALGLAAYRGVEVDIVVPRRSNHRVVDFAMQAHIGPLLDRGVRFWYGHPPFNHSKLMVVDKRWCLMGSANWDLRSLRLNFELDVEIYSRELAAEIEGLMHLFRQDRLRKTDLDARNVAARLRDAGLRLLLPYI